jgi:VanZ family protein
MKGAFNVKFGIRTWSILGIMYVVYIVYGTLLPFDFSFSKEMIENSLGNIEWIQRYGRNFYTTENVDAIVNFLIFIPLGIIIINIRSALGQQRWFIFEIVIATLSGLFLSVIIELSQLLLKARMTSLIDIIMNSFGSFSGACISIILPKILTSSARGQIRNSIKKIPDIILILPLFFLGFFLTESLSYYFVKSEKIGGILFNWQYIIQPVWIWQILLVYIPMSMLVTRMSRKVLKIVFLPAFHFTSFIITLVISAVLELFKIYIFNNSLHYINVIYGIIGIIIGIAISEIWEKDCFAVRESERRRIIFILASIYAFFSSLILYKFSYPFTFDLQPAHIIDKSVFFLLSVYSFIPFYGLEKLIIFSLQNIILFIPIGIIIHELESYLLPQIKRLIIIILSLISIILPLIVQFININQIPFLYELPTDILGILSGYILWKGLRNDSV